MDNRQLNVSDLDFNDPPSLIWMRVKDAIDLLWNENPKLHDMGGVVTSIVKHGFQEIPKFDSTLMNVKGEKGAIKAGNGRVEALFRMEQDKMELPRGLAVIKESGDWAMPLLVGTDALSLALARAYAVDSNNLTMAGGDFTAYDMARMWDPKSYQTLLSTMRDADVLPVSMDADDIDFLTKHLNYSIDDEYTPEESDTLGMKQLTLVFTPEQYERVMRLVDHIIEEQNPTFEGNVHRISNAVYYLFDFYELTIGE